MPIIQEEKIMSKNRRQQILIVSSDDTNKADYHFVVEENSIILIKIQGSSFLDINFDIQVYNNSSFTCLFVNDNSDIVKINDHYTIGSNCDVQVAYSLLNKGLVETNSVYDLDGQGTQLHVLSASISSEEKKINQICNHLVSNTIAQIDNYGVVFENGNCQMVVKNVINKGKKNCQTHQTNRLLTFADNAIGKILPILYIDDNEVAASHACSIGQPDQQQIYYLQSRGLTYKQSVQLITSGYLMPITKVIDNEELNEILRKEIETRVMQ